MTVKSISVRDAAKQWSVRNPGLVLLDVREQFEYDIVHIPGSLLIPLQELSAKLDSLDKTKVYLVLCKKGGRSAQAAEFLASNGFLYVYNVLGGIAAWASEVDKSLPVY